MSDHYSTLNINMKASDTEIKKAYRKLVLTLHPDKNAGLSDEAKKTKEAEFRNVQEAYEVLIDPQKRKLYDQELMNPTKENSNSQNDWFQQQYEEAQRQQEELKQKEAERREREKRFYNKAKNAGYTDMHLAVLTKNRELLSSLASRQYPDPKVSSTGHTPLHIAVLKKDHESARILLENDADPNARLRNGFTPLIIAICENNKSMIGLLIQYDADPKQGMISTKTDFRKYFEDNHNADEKILKRVDRWIEKEFKNEDKVYATPSDMAFLLGRKDLDKAMDIEIKRKQKGDQEDFPFKRYR